MSKFEDARTMAKERYENLKVKFVDPKFPIAKIADYVTAVCGRDSQSISLAVACCTDT